MVVVGQFEGEGVSCRIVRVYLEHGVAFVVDLLAGHRESDAREYRGFAKVNMTVCVCFDVGRHKLVDLIASFGGELE